MSLVFLSLNVDIKIGRKRNKIRGTYLFKRLAYKQYNRNSRSTKTKKLVIKLFASFILNLDLMEKTKNKIYQNECRIWNISMKSDSIIKFTIFFLHPNSITRFVENSKLYFRKKWKIVTFEMDARCARTNNKNSLELPSKYYRSSSSINRKFSDVCENATNFSFRKLNNNIAMICANISSTTDCEKYIWIPFYECGYTHESYYIQTNRHKPFGIVSFPFSSSGLIGSLQIKSIFVRILKWEIIERNGTYNAIFVKWNVNFQFINHFCSNLLPLNSRICTFSYQK